MNTNDKMQPISSASKADERAKFEAWIYERGQEHMLTRDAGNPSMYRNSGMQYWWMIWQAASIKPDSAIVPPVVQAPIDRKSLEGWSIDIQGNGDILIASPSGDSAHVFMDDISPLGEVTRQLLQSLAFGSYVAPIVATVPSEQKPIARITGAELGYLKNNCIDELLPVGTELYAAPSPTEQASDVFAAKRLRRVAVLAGVADAVPQDDAQLLECMGSVLGMIARKLEGETSNVQDEYEAFREWYEKEAPVEGEVSEIDMARHGWLAGRRSTEFTPLKSATPADKGNAPAEAKS